MEYDNPFGPGLIGFFIFIAIVYITAQWRIYEKAGQPGWASLIPIYNIIVLLEIIGKPWWWLFLLIFLPGINLIFAVWMTNLLSKSFGEGVGFTLGLLFLGFVFYPILGFSNREYQGPAGKQMPMTE